VCLRRIARIEPAIEAVNGKLFGRLGEEPPHAQADGRDTGLALE
jgi:hypothetical protein